MRLQYPIRERQIYCLFDPRRELYRECRNWPSPSRKSSEGDPSVAPLPSRVSTATKIDARGIVRPETELSSIRGVDEGGGVGGKGMFEMRHAGLTRIGLE